MFLEEFEMEEDVYLLLDYGFSADEIEEMLMNPNLLRRCINRNQRIRTGGCRMKRFLAGVILTIVAESAIAVAIMINMVKKGEDAS